MPENTTPVTTAGPSEPFYLSTGFLGSIMLLASSVVALIESPDHSLTYIIGWVGSFLGTALGVFRVIKGLSKDWPTARLTLGGPVTGATPVVQDAPGTGQKGPRLRSGVAGLVLLCVVLGAACNPFVVRHTCVDGNAGLVEVDALPGHPDGGVVTATCGGSLMERIERETRGRTDLLLEEMRALRAGVGARPAGR